MEKWQFRLQQDAARKEGAEAALRWASLHVYGSEWANLREEFVQRGLQELGFEEDR